MRVIFVPGLGREGAAAWPFQEPAALGSQIDATFLAHRESLPGPDALLDTLGDEGAHVVAHSAGGVAATLAAEARPDLIHSLTLFEPACFSLARGWPEVEAHISQLTPFFDRAALVGANDTDVAVDFLTTIGTPGPFTPGPELAALGARLRTMPAPWSHTADPSFLGKVRTLVITGGWSALYAEVARSLESSGARWQTLEGCGHRPQDCPGATEVMRAHWLA